jgi:hypothetical protein
MLFEIIVAGSENHAKRIRTLCWQNAELLIVKAGGIYKLLSTRLERVNILPVPVHSIMFRDRGTRRSG